MTNDAHPAENTIRITTPAALLEGLRSPDTARRASLLKAIRNEPGTALAFGPVGGRDVVDELLCLCEESNGTAERWDYVFTALSLVDPRTAGLARTEFLATHDHRYLVAAARRLSCLPEPEKTDFLSSVLMESRDANRCRLSANVLAGCRRLEPRVAIRVAALSDRPGSLPPLNEETLDAWIEELQGPYPEKVGALVLQTGGNAAAVLLSFWDRLPEQLRVWGLRRDVEAGGEASMGLLREVIVHEQGGALLQAALDCLSRVASEHCDETVLAPLYGHPDPAVRAAAIRAGSAAVDGAPLFAGETSEEVRVALVERLDRCGGEDVPELLASLLEDRSWRVRARATDALVTRAPASLALLRAALSSPCEEARVAAARALMALGKEDWIMEALPCYPD